MTAELINQLTTPLIFAVFTTGFALIWLRYRNLTSAGFFSLSYLFGTIAFLFDFFEGIFDVHQTGFGIYISAFGDEFYLLLAASFTIGIAYRYGQQIPWRMLGTLFAAGTFGLLWLWFVDQNTTVRSYVVTSSCSLLMIIAVPLIWRGREFLIDRILAWLVIVSCVQIVLNPVIAHSLAQETLTMQNMWGSTFLAVVNFTSAMIGLAIAMVLFVRFGIVIISNYQKLSNIDPLSGLINRRGLDRALHQIADDDETDSLPISVVVADLDHFKRLNDTLGHDFGDTVIRNFASILRSASRQEDAAARVGGEEFMLLLPNCSLPMAEMIAQSVRQSFSAFDHRAGRGEPYFVTASFGVAEREPGESFSELFKRADQALYQAKESGRDRVSIASGQSCGAAFETPVNQTA